MATILVETRGELRCNPILDAMATACTGAGHSVVRWRGPLSGRIAVSRRLKPCDVAILFNGTHAKYAPTVSKLRDRGVPILFVELGWYPQLETIQFDTHGINADASWVGRQLESTGHTPLEVRGRDLLVVLQHDQDTQITRQSPWFRDMAEFVAHLAKYSRLPVRLRKHPRHKLDSRVYQLAEQYRCKWDMSPSLTAALDGARAVACINSSSAVEALAVRLPVMCYGRSIYRQPGVVYCLTNDNQGTIAATAELAVGKCSLFVERVEELLHRIDAKQTHVQDLPSILPSVVGDLIAKSNRPATPSWRSLLPLSQLARLFGGARPQPSPIKSVA